MDKQDRGKLIISAAKSLKGFQLADSGIANFLYGTSKAGRLGLFVASTKAEQHAEIERIKVFAAEEGIDPHDLSSTILPWLEDSGLYELHRDSSHTITEVTSLALAYNDILVAVSDFYDSRLPSKEDQACLLVLAQANELPQPESTVRHIVASAFDEQIAAKALQIAKAYRIVDFSGSDNDPLLYAPRVWANLHSKAPQALASLDATDREVLLYLVNRVKDNQGYPESLLTQEASQHGVQHLVELATGIALINRTELTMANGTARTFLTTPHFYSELENEFGEDMCDRVKIFLDSIRNGQYYGRRITGKISDPRLLLRALVNRGAIGPATAIGTDYIMAEKAGIIRVRKDSRGGPVMELQQEETVRKVLEVVSTGTIEPEASQLKANDILDGRAFRSIEQGRAEFGGVSGNLAEIENAILNTLREG